MTLKEVFANKWTLFGAGIVVGGITLIAMSRSSKLSQVAEAWGLQRTKGC
jgi:hypothetical protein